MKKKKVHWKSFNINMPSELIPIYDFLQDELNFILSNVLDSTIQVELGVRPLSEVLPYNSLIDYYNKLQM